MDHDAPALRRPIEVIIADDHAIVRDGIRSVLEREDGEFTVIAEAADIPSMVRVVRELKPDLLTLDLTMPEARASAHCRRCSSPTPPSPWRSSPCERTRSTPARR